jgi:ubiquinone/menaquinone biosynthesis C-methylase UbiE
MQDTQTKILIQGVKDKYLQPEELEDWSRIIEDGLSIHEDHYIKEFVGTEGILLDIGCGGGRESIALSTRGYKVVGIDLVPDMVTNACMNADKEQADVKYSVMNALTLGFKDNSFGGALMLGQVLTFIPFRKNRILALKEVFRVLKPGGKLIMTTHSRNSHIKYQLYFLIMDNWRRLLNLLRFKSLEPGDRFASTIGNAKSKGKHFLHMYSMPEACHDLLAAGFQIIRCNSRKEIMQNREAPEKRERDYYLIYAAVKN